MVEFSSRLRGVTSKWIALVLGLSLAVWIVGCGSSDSAGQNGECDSNDDCSVGQYCNLTSHTCQSETDDDPEARSCRTHGDCAVGQYCDEETKTCTTSDAVGNSVPCGSSNDCPEGEFCAENLRCYGEGDDPQTDEDVDETDGDEEESDAADNPFSCEAGTQDGTDVELLVADPLEIVGELDVAVVKDMPIRNLGSNILRIDSLELGDPNGDFSLDNADGLPICIPHNGTYTLKVTFTKTDAGVSENSLTIVSNDPVQPSLTITIKGTERGVPRSLIQPSSPIDFGMVNPDEEKSIDVSITNFPDSASDTAVLKVTNVFLDPEQNTPFSLSDDLAGRLPTLLTPQALLDFDVIFTPTLDSRRDFNATLVFETNDPNPVYTDGRIEWQLVGEIGYSRLEITPESIDFGDVPVGGHQMIRVNVANKGTIPVEILEFGFVEASVNEISTSNALNVNQVIAVDFTTGVTIDFRPVRVETYERTLRIRSTSAFETIKEIPITGRGIRGTLGISPDFYDFGGVPTGQIYEEEISLNNLGDSAITIESFEEDPSNSNFELILHDTNPNGTLTIDGQQSKTATARFYPQVSGFHAAQFTFNLEDSEVRPTLSLQGTAGVISIDIRTSDGELLVSGIDFGEVRIGQSATETVTFKNVGSIPYYIREFVMDPVRQEFSIDPMPVPGQSGVDPVPLEILPDDELDIDFTFTPIETRRRGTQLSIYSNQAGSIITYTLSGVGVAPSLQITPQSSPGDRHDFGPIVVGRQGPEHELVLTNVGSGGIAIDAVVLLSENQARDTSDFVLGEPSLSIPRTLTEGDEIRIPMQFEPTAEGASFAKIVVYYDETETAIIYLQGEGIVCSEPHWDVDENPADCEYTCTLSGTPLGYEWCDEVDNDCDGETDEDYELLGQNCRVNTNCELSYYICNPENTAEVICAITWESRDIPELCDGEDNNCDGAIDNDACPEMENATYQCIPPNCTYTCNRGFHRCTVEGDEQCVPNGSLEHCGMRCNAPCPGPDSGPGYGDCLDVYNDGYFTCEIICDENYVSFEGSCVVTQDVNDCAGQDCEVLFGNVENGVPVCVPEGDSAVCTIDCDRNYRLNEDGDGCILNDTPTCCGPTCEVCMNFNPQTERPICENFQCRSECLDDFHLCSGVCVSNHAVETCGTEDDFSCTACPGPSNGMGGHAECINTTCELVCDEEYHECSGNRCERLNDPNNCGLSCKTCPTVDHSERLCEDNQCVYDCQSGYHLCNEDDPIAPLCLSDTSASSCGDRCEPCPGDAHGMPACVAGECSLDCHTDYHLCGGTCVWDFDVNNCGDRCEPCTTDVVGATPVCDAGTCDFECNEGLKRCGDLCVAVDDPDYCNNCAPCGEEGLHVAYSCEQEDGETGPYECVRSCEDDWYDIDELPSNGCEYPCTVVEGEDWPDEQGIDNNCDGVDGEIEHGIWVSINGFDTASGSPKAPVASLSVGISKAETQLKKYVIVSTGDFYSPLSVRNGISVYGGYKHTSVDFEGCEAGVRWCKNTNETTNIILSSIYGFNVNNIDLPTTVDGFQFFSPNASTEGQNSYGAYISNTTEDFVVSNCTITAGDGKAGNDGSNAGRNGMAGTDGSDGENGGSNGNSNTQTTGGSGGTGCTGGGRGGDGNWSDRKGDDGSDGDPAVNEEWYAAGGAGGIVQEGSRNGASGQNGHTGANGTDGTGGNGGTVDAGRWISMSGENGGVGGWGGSGGGGGGGAGKEVANASGDELYGGAGGGGAGGGCGATGGDGGNGGGASIGVFLKDSSPTFVNVTVFCGDGGDGGNGRSGGIGGGYDESGVCHPAQGGEGGGSGSWYYHRSGTGGHGGSGGCGGNGGHGGGGAGGPVYGVYLDGTSSAQNMPSGTSWIILGTPGSGGASEGNPGSAGALESIGP